MQRAIGESTHNEVFDRACDLDIGAGEHSHLRFIAQSEKRHWWCHHDDNDNNISKEHFIYRLEHVQMNGWFSLLNIVAWIYTLVLIFIIGMQVFGQIHAKHNVILISYEIAYPMFLLVVGYRQLMRHFIVMPIAWLCVAGINIYFNVTFISVLASCSENEMCNDDQITFVWYLGLFLVLSGLDLLTMIIYVRVLPIVLHVDEYFKRNAVENYVKHLAYFCGQAHPHHVRNVYAETTGSKEDYSTNAMKHDSRGYDVLIHTTHHTLKNMTLRVPSSDSVFS